MVFWKAGIKLTKYRKCDIDEIKLTHEEFKMLLRQIEAYLKILEH